MSGMRNVWEVSPAGRVAAKAGADGTRWYSSEQAAEALGITVEAVYKARKRGTLGGTKRGRCWLHSAADLVRYQSGRITAARARTLCWQLFEEGHGPARVVIDLGLPPAMVAHEWRQYCELSSHWVVAAPKGPKAAWEATFGLGPLSPQMILCALELVARHPKLRPQLLASVKERDDVAPRSAPLAEVEGVAAERRNLEAAETMFHPEPDTAA